MNDPAPVLPIESPLLAAKAGNAARHGFFTRTGGVSANLYRGLNVGFGSKDERGHVAENRARVCRWFGVAPQRLATVHQVHSPDVVTVGEDHDGARRQADALVTATPELVIGVLTADCGPILFCDPQAGVAGAAHAGWKGALGGVLENTIAAMERLGAKRERIAACLGPSIGPQNYEVGPEFVERFVTADPDYERFFVPSDKPGHAMFDLPGLTTERLTKAGVAAENLDLCTYPDEERFFSYRRATHRGEPDYGRQMSAIMIRA
ncbi:peptidoglycan editing factor PgeF [Shinella daejeonensis]|uniref:peptidoglycan editing factor PgeF n=1 Tax=Shinella daejeonensis TaxID=659017 RepID=UPI0020C7F6A0|nr:peptidoglycan editing factor PgeF [Shinella daejeonensis]MCP8893983.1 peptidoglycan editing factor PgeF [Shinella daejeonensis]